MLSSNKPVGLHMDLTSRRSQRPGGQIYLNDAANGSSQSELSANSEETQVEPQQKITIKKEGILNVNLITDNEI